jgi:hypothetical protein
MLAKGSLPLLACRQRPTSWAAGYTGEPPSVQHSSDGLLLWWWATPVGLTVHPEMKEQHSYATVDGVPGNHTLADFAPA